MLKCCFTSTETVGSSGPGAQDAHLDFHTALELCKALCVKPEDNYSVEWRWEVRVGGVYRLGVSMYSCGLCA